MDAHNIRESDASSDSSSASSSSSDTVLIAKPLNQKHRKKLQAQLQQDEHASPSLPLSGRAAVVSDNSSSSATITTPAAASSKNDLICLVCEQEGELLQCAGPCVSAFHLACLGATTPPLRGEAWKCPSCTSSTHVCFHCKRLGASVSVDAPGAPAPSASSPRDDALRPVRKCRALSCGKFYHSDCIAKLPLARIAGANFICPLHTCAACEQSGAKKESVRCVRCPVAFHTSCLPQHSGLQVLGKRIICPKHSSDEARATPQQSVVLSQDTAPAHAAQRATDASDVRDRRTTEAHADHVGASSSGTSSSSASQAKKLAKSLKREKKKKKKSKRKKEKKRRDRSSHDADPDASATTTSGREAVETASPHGDETEQRSNDRESDARDSIELPALTIPSPEAVSPATSSSLFESPATSNERIKARLVEALGQSDDDVESSLGSPIALPAPASGAVGDSAEGTVQSPAAARDRAPSADDNDSSREHTTEAPDTVPATGERSSQRPTVSAAEDDDDNTVGRSPSDSASQSSGEKAARQTRRESQSPVPTHAKDLSKAFTDTLGAGERQSSSSSKKQKLALDELSVAIPNSPAPARRSLQALVAPAGQQQTVEKDRVSEGEDGDDEGPGGSSTPTLRRRVSTGGGSSATPRNSSSNGDHATDEHKTKTSRASKPKKKKKRVKSAPERPVDATVQEDGAAGGDASRETVVREEAKWVQCDSCKKWRTVPKAIDLDAMPERWYCKMNTWDAAFASCGVAEEVVNGTEAKKPKHSSKRSKVRAKAPAKTPVADAQQAVGSVSDGGASSPSSGAGSYTSKTPVVSDVLLDDHATATTVSGGDSSSKSSKLAKKQEKHAKKRKLKLKLKEKYREVKWVQCESAACGKWRVVPSSVDVGLLPAVWTCELNTWSPELATCAAPNPPEVETFLSKSHSKKSSSSSAGGASRPSKKLKASSDGAVAASEASAASSTAGAGATLSSGAGASGPDHAPPPTAHKSAKPAKAPKGGVNPPSASTAQHASANSSSSGADASAASSSAPLTSGVAGTCSSSSGSFGSSGLAGASAAAGTSASSSTASGSGSGSSKGRKVKPDGIKKTVLEWAQCEKCNKWRKLPQHIKSSTLPDKWYCTMNHWDPARASCAMPEEVDQEPLSASPLPSSQNWYPMPGHVTGASGVRSKRSKLSYSELLYASTGQLRKTYTSESSTHTFELDGRVYRRDDQYKDSSMYVSPDALVRATAAVASSSTSKQPTVTLATSRSSDSKSAVRGADTVEMDKAAIARLVAANPLSVEQVATLVLDAMDLRHSSTVAELFHAASSAPRTGESGGVALSLALVAAAVHHLVQRGLLEALERGDHESDEPAADDKDSSSSARVGSKRRKSTDALYSAASSSSPSPLQRVQQYRKVPKRPLKASKCWKLGHSAFEFPLKE